MERAITKTGSSKTKKDGANTKTKIHITQRDIKNIIVSLLGFFAGRVVILGTLNPLATAFLVNFSGKGYRFYLSAAFILMGYYTKLTGPYFTKYLIGLVFLCCANWLCGRLIHKNTFPPALEWGLAGFSLFLAGLITWAVNNFGIYYLALSVLEGILAGVAAFIMKKGILIVDSSKSSKMLDSEEIISVAVLAGTVIVGAAEIYVGGVALKYMLTFLILLVAGYKGGSAMGALAGLVMGLVLYISGVVTAGTLSVFSLSGACAGAVRDFGKPAALGSVAVGTLIGAYFLNNAMLDGDLYLSFAISAALFMLMPDSFYFNLGASLDPADDRYEYIDRVKEITSQRLNGFSASFERLAKTFSGLAEKKSGLNQKDISRLIDDLATKTCINCKYNRQCWENDFYNTYQTIFGMLEDCEKKGEVAKEDWPKFQEICCNADEFVDNLMRCFDLYKSNLIWHNRIVETRELVYQQLKGVSGIIGRLAEELSMDLVFKEDLEDAMLRELAKHKLEISSIMVLANKEGKYEVNIGHRACYGKGLHTQILSVAEKTLDRRMRLAEAGCNIEGKNGCCRLKLIEEQKYRFTVGMARLPKIKAEPSGDSYSFMELKNGQCLLALSDGMGSGKRAMEESTAAIELLEEFIETGFEKELAVKMINSVLVLKSSDDSFSTLDICTVDLYTGAGEFIKIGAASTFILRNGHVQLVKSSSLPIGILNTVDLEVSVKNLKHNDMIIMVTDGVLEAQGLGEGELWLSGVIQDCRLANPQDMADHILGSAKEAWAGEPRDDMTVLAAKLWEKM